MSMPGSLPAFSTNFGIDSLGFRVGLMMVTGRDFDGKGYRQYLEEAGVDLQGVQVLRDGLSGHSFLFSDPEGTTICISHLGAAARQEEMQPNHALLGRSRAVLLNYQFDHFTLSAGEIARAAGALVVTSGDLTTSSMPERFVGIADVLIANRFELEYLAQRLGVGEIRALQGMGPRIVILTAGAQGVLVLTQEGEEIIQPVMANAVVDPTGAGDAFAGATTAALARGASTTVAARIGAATASFVVEARGCQTNLPTWGLMSQRYLRTFGDNPPPLIDKGL